MKDRSSENPDHFHYHAIMFPDVAIEYYRAALEFYKSLLDADLKAIQDDRELKIILSANENESLKVSTESEVVARLIDWMSPRDDEQRRKFGSIPLSVSHGTLRYLKSAGLIYLKKLRQSRDQLASRPNVLRSTLEAVDQNIALWEENLSKGVFNKVSPRALLVDDSGEIRGVSAENKGSSG